MDRALWITWYDLAVDGRDAYLSWLHETYIPGVLKRPGFLWGAHYASVEESMRRSTPGELRIHTDDSSIPTGDRYILLFGAEDADVFGKPVPSVLHAELSVESRKMLAMRIGERVNIMAECARVEGPEAKEYKGGMALAPCIQLGSFNCAWQHEEEMLTWYAQWRMPAMRRTLGCIRTRKLASVSGWAKHGILYEFVSLGARNQHFIEHEDGHPTTKAWQAWVTKTLIHAPGSSSLACRIWPAPLD